MCKIISPKGLQTHTGPITNTNDSNISTVLGLKVQLCPVCMIYHVATVKTKPEANVKALSANIWYIVYHSLSMWHPILLNFLTYSATLSGMLLADNAIWELHFIYLIARYMQNRFFHFFVSRLGIHKQNI